MMYYKKLYGTTVINNKDSEEIVEDSEIELEYYGIKNAITFFEDMKPYGIEVIKKEIANEQLKIETKVINNICVAEYEINRLLEILMSNKVTPIGVSDVLADMISV